VNLTWPHYGICVSRPSGSVPRTDKYAMPGRKPKPTALKVLQGNPGKRPLNKAEPKPVGPVTRPTFMGGRAAELWDEYAPKLIELGILTSVDAHMFAVWCSLMADFETDPTEFNANRISQMRALASSFGMDSSSRSRMVITPPKTDTEDEWERLRAL
jgi:phage terminase small subunit